MRAIYALRLTSLFGARLFDSCRADGGWVAGVMRKGVAVSVAAALALGLVGCSSLDPVPTYEQITDPAKMFMALAIDHPALALSTASPYNTFQLTAVPKNALGDPMPDLPPPVFSLVTDVDSTKVTVTPAGFVTAKSETPPEGVAVVAELRTGDNVRRTDTAFVQVTTDPAPPVLASLSIAPIAPDSAVWPIGFAASVTRAFLAAAGLIQSSDQPFRVKPQIRDAANNPITGLRIEYKSLDSAFAVVNRWTGEGRAIRPGHARMVASTTAYGVSKADTFLFTTTWPVFQDIRFDPPGLEPTDVWLAPNGLAIWFNFLTDPVDVTFDDPTNVAGFPLLCSTAAPLIGRSGDCGPGNFSLPVQGQYGENGCFYPPWCYNAIRQFPVPGIYPYRTSTGARGRVIVTSDTTVS